MTEPPLDLGAAFPAVTAHDWRAAVERVLRGRPFDEVLVTEICGLDIQPLYTAAETAVGPSPVSVDTARIAGGWDVRQQHSADDSDACNAAILDDLEMGVSSIELIAPAVGWTAGQMASALAGVMFDMAPVALAPHSDPKAARALAAVIAERGDSETTDSWLGLDPVGAVSRGEEGLDISAVAPLVADLASRLPRATLLTVDTTRYADAGATEVQQLAWSVAAGVEYLRGLEVEGLSIEHAAAAIGFRVNAGPDQFVTLAFMRALRLVWGRILEASGLVEHRQGQRIHAVTARSMFSRRDPWVNMVRSTSATLGAALGGADAITVLPFDCAEGRADAFSRRNARNTQLLLIEESGLARSVDPGAGAWFVESLTARMAQKAWLGFQTIEASGSMSTALANGTIRSEVDASWQTRSRRVAHRTDRITAVSEFVTLADDNRADVGEPPPSPEGGFPLRRPAEPFERLRDAADRFTDPLGRRPTVHLTTLGRVADHEPRSTWITNLLAVGGIAAEGASGDGAASPLEASARFIDSTLSVAVICGSDATYVERAVSTITALKEAGAEFVALAAEPSDHRDDLLRAGLDEFWFDGVDVLELLDRLHGRLGVD